MAACQRAINRTKESAHGGADAHPFFRAIDGNARSHPSRLEKYALALAAVRGRSPELVRAEPVAFVERALLRMPNPEPDARVLARERA